MQPPENAARKGYDLCQPIGCGCRRCVRERGSARVAVERAIRRAKQPGKWTP